MYAVSFCRLNGFVFDNQATFIVTLRLLESTFEKGTYKIIRGEAGGNFYVQYILFDKQEDMNLFLLTTSIKGLEISEETIL